MSSQDFARSFLLVFMFLATVPDPASAGSVRGQISSIWGDPLQPGLPAEKLLFLTTDDGRTIPLGRESDWFERGLTDGMEVMLPEGALRAGGRADLAGQMTVVPRAVARSGHLGAARWITLLCRFSDHPQVLQGASHYAGMYGAGRDRIPDLWLDQSYGALTIQGLGAVGWLDLPHPRDFYVPPGERARIGLLGDDCFAAADPFVDFSQVDGVNLFFNAALDGFIYGGSRRVTTDGVNDRVGVTYLFEEIGLTGLAHEMGHSFGLPHSNNSDQDRDPYDNAWDVMSQSAGFWRPEPTYGSVGIHTNAYHKDLLGWIPPERKLDFFCGEQRVALASLAHPGASGYRLVRIHLPGQTRFYNLEVRGSGYYDAGISASGISGRRLILYEVESSRAEPAWVLEKNQPPSNYTTEAAAWDVGETWRDPSGIYSVHVAASRADGLDVDIIGPACVASRFDVEVTWKDSAGNRGTGTVIPFGAGDSKLFWFFSPENWEMMVKVLDGCALNGHFWVFAAATTNVEYTLRVVDTRTGASKTYFKALGPPAPAITDTKALRVCDAPAAPAEPFIPAERAAEGLYVWEDPNRFPGPCRASGYSLCLEDGRFEVRVTAHDFESKYYNGRLVPYWTRNSGVFWFFGPDNWELMVKILNGCALNRKYWVFAAATTNVEYLLIVRDTQSGTLRFYQNFRGQVSPAATDTSAFGGCP